MAARDASPTAFFTTQRRNGRVCLTGSNLPGARMGLSARTHTAFTVLAMREAVALAPEAVSASITFPNRSVKTVSLVPQG